MSGYNYNQYDGGGIPDQGNNGLPLVLADANLPTQAVSQSPVTQGTTLNYSPAVVESNLYTPATTQKTLPAKNAATPQPVKQSFKPTSQPVQPPLWRTVLRAVIGGSVKTGSSYAATGDYTSAGTGQSTSGASGQMASTGGTGTITAANSK